MKEVLFKDSTLFSEEEQIIDVNTKRGHKTSGGISQRGVYTFVREVVQRGGDMVVRHTLTHDTQSGGAVVRGMILENGRLVRSVGFDQETHDIPKQIVVGFFRSFKGCDRYFKVNN